MAAAVKAVKPGITESQVAAEAEYAMRQFGAEEFWRTYVSSGLRTNIAHGLPTQRRLQAGDLVMIDIHPIVGGYSADICRTVCAGGKPSAAVINPAAIGYGSAADPGGWHSKTLIRLVWCAEATIPSQLTAAQIIQRFCGGMRDPPRVLGDRPAHVIGGTSQNRRTVDTNRSRSIGLRMTSTAPRRFASTSASGNALRIITGTPARSGSGSLRCSSRNSQPFIIGIVRSNKIRQGRHCLSAASAAFPFSAPTVGTPAKVRYSSTICRVSA